MLTPKVKSFVLIVLSACAVLISARCNAQVPAVAPDKVVALLRDARNWNVGPFFNGGVGVGDRSDFTFISAGLHAGRAMTSVVHAGPLSGQFELGADIMPLWRSFTPDAHSVTVTKQGQTYTNQVAGGNYAGVSMTPVILRWNFLTPSRRVMPWFQGAGGLLYTTHKYPGVVLVPHGSPGGTSVWNFEPQGGVGVHYFLSPNRSIDLGVNAVHISSASLGDKNPGVNASMQFQVGYTFWK